MTPGLSAYCTVPLGLHDVAFLLHSPERLCRVAARDMLEASAHQLNIPS